MQRILLTLLCFSPLALQAATFTVTNTNDSGTGSLRAAIDSADLTIAEDVIDFSNTTSGPPGMVNFHDGALRSIILATGELNAVTPLIIIGPGANRLIINGNNASRIFNLGLNYDYSVSGLTLANGNAGSSNGGGIFRVGNGRFTLENCTVSGCDANRGGGLYITGSNITIKKCTINGNTAIDNGGGIYSSTPNSSGNSITISQSTITENSASSSGGVYVNALLLNFIQNTVSHNSALSSGGGLFMAGLPGTMNFSNNVCANNTGADFLQNSTTVTATGRNLVEDSSLTGATVINAAPLLGPLSNNGGPTPTRLPLPGSPLLDACSSSDDDQRGFTRPRDLTTATNVSGGNASDIGAVELQRDPVAVNPTTLAATLSTVFSQQLSLTGGSTSNYAATLLSGGLPYGLTFSSSGLLSGTPTSAGTFTFTVRLSDNGVQDLIGERTYTMTLSGSPATVSGVVSLWRGEGNANDSIGTNHATLNGSVTYAPGLVGQAFSFNGTNGYVALPDNVFPIPTSGTGTTPFSFEVWFKVAPGGGGVILSQQESSPYGTAGGYVPAIYIGTDGRLRVSLFWRNSTTPVVTFPASLTDSDRFHHLVVTFDGAREKTYLDGTLGSDNAFAQTGYGAGNYRYSLGTGNTAGSWPSNNGGYDNFNGLIDEPSLYNRALTQTEAQALFLAGNEGKAELGSLVVTRASDATDSNDFQTTLREAVSYAATLSGTQTITFSNQTNNGAVNFHDGTSRAITLGGSDITVSSALTIIGPGASRLNISGNNMSCVFLFNSGLTNTLSGLSIVSGVASGISKINGSLTLDDCVISGNSSVANGSGGGIDASNGSLTLNRCTVMNNFAEGRGGGISAFNCTVLINDCDIRDNTANVLSSAIGGGIYAQGGSLNINNSTISGNTANNSGGGIAFFGVMTGTLTNCTISGNSVTNQGGAISLTAGPKITLRHCTLSGNVSTNSAVGGIRADGSTTVLTLANSIIANSTGTDIGRAANTTLTLSGQNLVEDNSVTVGVIHGDPLLGPLANNGGLTRTHALLAGSPAINAGDNSALAGLTTDQRGSGFPRVINSTVDLGSFESATPMPLADWRVLHGLAANGSQDLGNPSADGVKNLLKYAFNLAPNAGSLNQANLTVLSINGTAGLPNISRKPSGELQITFLRRTSASNPSITYTVETGSTLTDFSALSVTETVVAIDVNWERVTVTDPATNPKRFGRVRISTN
jgi:parallel beta-helix repeat protein